MQAFFDTARVQPVKEGLYFYEKDIIMSSYLFNRDVTIDINLLYKRSGFGIVIAEDSPEEPKHSYLYHLGSNSFAVYERHLLQQYEYSTRANILSVNDDIHLMFTLQKNKGKIFLLSTDTDGSPRETLLGEHTILRKMPTYYIGFYSQAGNTIKDVTFLQGIPDRWHCSIANVHGGRISFWDDGFMFENCIRDAELEQKEIILPAGTFWLDYKTSEVNGKYDIEGFIYKSYIPDPPSDINSASYERDISNFHKTYLEDTGKMLVHNQGVFTLTEETSVILSFKGMNGRINDVCIKDTRYGEYLSTDSEARRIDGSWITIDITDVVAFEWEGIVFATPPYEDFSQPCPYALMSSVSDRVTPEALSVDLNKQYNFYYDVRTSRLEAVETDTLKLSGYDNLNVTEADNNKVKIFVNMKVQITNLILTMNDGSKININLQKTLKAFVPGYIVGPIIVTDEERNSFDLSGSYREVVDDNQYVIDLFSQSALELKLTYHTGTLWQSIEVFGIPKGATVDMTQTDINLFTDMYTVITSDLFSVSDDIISVPPEVRDDYAYIAVKYQRSDSYSYLLTVYERELFDGSEDILKLSAQVNESGKDITVYGIYQDSLKKEYLLRVPNREMLTAIDLCASKYDMISPVYYTVESDVSAVRLSTELADRYEYYIVDYMKKDSYAVNWNDEGQQYEVDIATDHDVVLIHYEMDDNGQSTRTIRTDINSDDNKFIILRRNKGAFSDED